MKKRFYPFAESRGFVREKSINPLFTTFRRKAGNRIQVFEIQWDKYWRPCFVINFGKGSIEDERIDYEGRLQRRRGGGRRCWFGTSRPWAEKLVSGKWNYAPEEVVSEVIAAFAELESWWAEGNVGRHLNLWRPGK